MYVLAYGALPLPHKRWGSRTIGRLRLTGDETVAGAGCGTGRDAEYLLQVLPWGRVVAIDGSRQMLAQTRSRLAGAGVPDPARLDAATSSRRTWPPWCSAHICASCRRLSAPRLSAR